MDIKPIYLRNIDLAIEMALAGFYKDCAHYAYYNYEHKAICFFGYYTEIARDYMGQSFVSKLNLPTLGEIELPVGYSVVKNTNDEWYISYYDEPCHNHTLNTYKTELEARCHAWLLANKKEDNNGNN